MRLRRYKDCRRILGDHRVTVYGTEVLRKQQFMSLRVKINRTQMLASFINVKSIKQRRTRQSENIAKLCVVSSK